MRIRVICSLLLALAMLFLSTSSFAQVRVSITIAPPELPVYDQPICPSDGYIWTPGYWAWADDDYYWVPGTWVLAPEVGLLWTPGYWGWGGAGFIFYEGYWGPQVGFYGGVNYGFGYFGRGYEGGRWDNGHFFYNTSVNNVNVSIIHNVYNTTVVNQGMGNRVSYNGGNGGIDAHPTPQEETAAHARQVPPVPLQVQHEQAARTDSQQRASVNHGAPPVAATPAPGAFKDRGVVSAKQPGAPSTMPARSDNNAPRPSTAVHPNDLPPIERPTPPNTGNPNLDQKYQKQQEQLNTKHQQERMKLQQKQDQDHQKLAKQNASDAKKQQVEQKHQQQTQQLVQKHTQEQQQLQQKQQPAATHESKPPRG